MPFLFNLSFKQQCNPMEEEMKEKIGFQGGKDCDRRQKSNAKSSIFSESGLCAHMNSVIFIMQANNNKTMVYRRVYVLYVQSEQLELV